MKSMILLALLCLFANTYSRGQSLADSIKKDPAYIVEDSILIKTRDGAQVSAWAMRKRNVTAPQPTIMQFTIYARQTDIRKMKDAVDRGYAGVMAYTRGKRYSPDEPVPYEKDGRDAYDVIEWITQQSWSNQEVGMYGGSYNGFTQWAAAKNLHPALKTIVTAASVAPGLDVPMTNNVAMSFVFPWSYYVSNNKFLDEADYRGPQWGDLYDNWFQKGSSYRSLDTLVGRPGNHIFQRWLDHPTYDSYWQSMIPYKEEFARITIPVLSTTGYYDGGQIGELYYFNEHLKYLPNARHYLLIGPYGHFGSQGYPDSVYNGYRIDDVARIPIHTIIFEWFDHIFKGRPSPAILKDRVNYQVMGTNIWKHAGSIETMSNTKLRLYLTDQNSAGEYGLSSQPQAKRFLKQEIDFRDRSTRNSYYYFNNIIYDRLFPNNGLLLWSDPLTEDMEINGRFTGQLKAMINKKDMDYSVALFEVRPDSSYFLLSYFMGRASYARSTQKRHLLKPGRKETIPFSNTYMVSRKLAKGSRIAIVLNINKSPFEQINYGTGKDVNRETIADARDPLHIKWFCDSYIDLPIFR
ncbi:MAG: CocE/NonD family hydrolase [Chitinophagaceae bacterium]|nr:CocE/NonD family hydrolase [Chitinophagaceae bacterium]